ncbi:unnamed protein product [Rotaria sp. Silwood2]|nr:unnamed protein product [Rotaria sp. Silwood2]CAF2468361.1 unnamed protein product [Rotaria sp. Silwood2]CAF2704134.1 unnamed protein product [Rotaria sp. Silwood2]CAF2856716.1 unnamed protein product [Rotaria sp. Silwood2]CAF3858360.1 unnamed protein product [Rotaria sp. Silwood2]
MAAADIDLTLYFRKKYTPPPSALLLKLPSNNSPTKDQQPRSNPSIELRSRQQKKRLATAHTVGVHFHNSDSRDSSVSPPGWQRHSDKIGHVAPAPDVAYRNTYMEETKREKSATINSDYRSHISSSRSPSPRSQHSQQQQHQQQLPRLKTASSSSYNTSDSSQRRYHEYRTVYDYIRQSIKQIERQRNLKQQNFSARIKRPQNDDIILRRALGEKKNSATSKISSAFKNDIRSPQNFLNYVNHSREQVRVLHTTTPNQPYQQQPQTDYKYSRQRTNLSQNQSDSPDKQQSIMMVTATVANS